MNRYPYFACLFLVAFAGLLWANSNGPPPDRSGVTGNTCNTSGCHNDFPLNDGGTVSIAGLPESGWSPGQTYPLMVSISRAATRYGFQMTAVDSNGTQAGSFTEGSGMAVMSGLAGGNTIQHVQHVFPQASNTFSFDWTAPAVASTGTVRFNVAGNAVNFNGSPTGDRIYTTERSVAAVTAQPSLTEVFYFPQIADGGQFSTTMFLTNPASSGTATITIGFTRSDGTPLDVSFVDSNGQSFNGSISLQLAGGTSRRLVSTATPETVQTGFATISSDVPIVGSAVFSQFSGAPATSTLLAEAGVTSASTGTSQAIFVDETAPFQTAVAYANPGQTDAAVTFDLLDPEGQTIRTTARTLAAGTHQALFVFQLFENLPGGHIGTLRVTSSVPVSIVSLRFAGSLFTSVPPFGLQ